MALEHLGGGEVDFSPCVQVTNKQRQGNVRKFEEHNIKMSRFSSKFNQKHELHHGEK